MVVNAARFVYRTLPRQQPPIAIRGSQPSHSTEASIYSASWGDLWLYSCRSEAKIYVREQNKDESNHLFLSFCALVSCFGAPFSSFYFSSLMYTALKRFIAAVLHGGCPSVYRLVAVSSMQIGGAHG